MKLLRCWYGDLSPGLRAFFSLLPVFILGGLAASVLISAYTNSSFAESIAIPVILCIALALFGLNHLLATAVNDARDDERGRFD
jgi:hypothetical protein